MSTIVKYSSGSTYTIVPNKVDIEKVQDLDGQYHIPNTSIVGMLRLGLGVQRITVSGDSLDMSACLWHDVVAISFDSGTSYQTVYFAGVPYTSDCWSGIYPYALSLLASPLREGAPVRYPTSGYKFGNQSITGISQAGNVSAFPTIHYLAPLFYAPLSNTLVDFAGQSVTFTRTASKTHGGIGGPTYPINTPIFDSGLYLASDTAQDVATWTPPASTVRTVAMQIKQTRYPSPWVIGTGSPTNLITNGEFETDTTGWVGENATLSRDLGSPFIGTGSLKVLVTSNGSADAYTPVTTIIGHTYVASCLAATASAAGRLCTLTMASNTTVYGTPTDCVASIKLLIVTFTATAISCLIIPSIVNAIANEGLYVDSVVCYDVTAMNNRNLLTPNQSNAETDTAEMSVSSGTLTRNTVTPIAGTGDFKVVATAAATDILLYTHAGNKVAVAAGLWYCGQALVKTSGCAGGRTIGTAIQWFNAAGTGFAMSYGNVIAAPTVATVISQVAVAPARAVSAILFVWLVGGEIGEILYADSLMVEAIPTELSIWRGGVNPVVYCMGDSLTGSSGHYPPYLAALLSGWTLYQRGVSGNNTTQMLARFTADVITPGDGGYCVIWGGVNDLAQGVSVGIIESNLQTMYTAAHNAGMKVIAVTITPVGGTAWYSSEVQSKQDAVNSWIMNTALNVNYRVDAYAVVVDPAVPYTLLPGYDDDHLHMTAAGYSAVATAIHNGVSWSALTKLSIDTVDNLLEWTDGVSIVSAIFPTAAYLTGASCDVVVIDGVSHAMTVAAYTAAGVWTTQTGTLAAIVWPQLTLGNLEGSIANLIQYPYVLTSSEYQALAYSSLSLLFNTLFVGNRYGHEIIKGSDKRLLNANGSDISALLGGTDIAIGASAVTIAQSQGLSARWYVEVKRTDV